MSFQFGAPAAQNQTSQQQQQSTGAAVPPANPSFGSSTTGFSFNTSTKPDDSKKPSVGFSLQPTSVAPTSAHALTPALAPAPTPVCVFVCLFV